MRPLAMVALTIAFLASGMPAGAQEMLTYDELKVCLTIQKDLEQRRQRLDAQGDAVRRNGAELDRVRAEVDEKQRLAAAYGSALTAPYDRLREEQYRLYDVYVEEQRAHNATVASYNRDLAEYDRRCGTKRYDLTQMARARAELGM